MTLSTRNFSFLISLVSVSFFWGCASAPKATVLAEYPIGIYGVPSTNDFWSLRKAGFNLIAGQANQAYLDAANAAGLRVLANLGTTAGPSFDPARARHAVAEFDKHPALWGWYLADEPDLNLIPPAQVASAHDTLKRLHARKPTAIVLYQGYEAQNYANLTDILMVDRYPIPWLPLANFGQHIRMARLALGKDKPLVAVIQAFDWSSYSQMLPGEKNLRAPTAQEIRCMTYDALARGANGLFYYAYDSGWKMREHPEVWEALKSVVQEVNARQPLFQAHQVWWPKQYDFGDPAHRFNAALESCISCALLRVDSGNEQVPPGLYFLAVNNTEFPQVFWFKRPGAESVEPVPVLGEERQIKIENRWINDAFQPFAVHVYGPFQEEPK